jgi:hypothetical protein
VKLGKLGEDQVGANKTCWRGNHRKIFPTLHQQLLNLFKMPAPSKLTIATSVVQRLVKEDASYRKEEKLQEARIEKLSGDSTDENAEYSLNQEVILIARLL